MKRTRPAGSEVTTYAYDTAGMLAAAANDDATLTFERDALGRLTGTAVTHAGHGQADRLLHHRSYTYREDGYLTEVRDLLDGTRRYDLDTAGRVTAVHAANWTEAYAYDGAGNLSHAATLATRPNPPSGISPAPSSAGPAAPPTSTTPKAA